MAARIADDEGKPRAQVAESAGEFRRVEAVP
jgi:hypothetical protein